MKVIMCTYGIVEFEGDLQRGGVQYHNTWLKTNTL